MLNKELTIRLEETSGEYKVTEWGSPKVLFAGTEYRSWTGPLEILPEWIQRIVTVAKVGGRMAPCKYSPPDYILWFVVDNGYNFLRFTNET